MALYIAISVNNTRIYTYGAERKSEKKDPGNYRVCTYVDTDKPGVKEKVYLPGILFHNYDDGAVVLAQKILEFVQECKGEQKEKTDGVQ